MKRWLWISIAMLLIFSLACSGLGLGNDDEEAEVDPVAVLEDILEDAEESGTAEEAATSEPAEDEVVAEEDGEAEAAAPDIDPNALDGLDSYHSSLSIRSEFDDGDIQDLTFEQDAVREPPAQRIVMSVTEAEETQSMEMVRIENTQWMHYGDEWIQTTVSEEEETFDEGMLLTYEDFTTTAGDENYRYLGKEKVNGINTRHYALDLDPADMAFLMLSQDADSVEAEVWVADEADLPEFAVKFYLQVVGEIEEGRQGTTTTLQEVDQINEPITIEAPEAAAGAGLPEDVPLYPGGTEMTSMSGMVMFKSTDDVETVGAFYDQELEASGWTLTDDGGMGEGMVVDTWEKEGRSLQVMITAGDDDAGSQVILTLEEE